LTQNLSFGGGVAETIVNPAVLAVVLFAGLLICILPRTRVIAPLLATGILIPTDQIIVAAGLHFPMLRLLALFGFLRMFWAKTVRREEILSGGINAIDVAIVILASFTALDGILLWQVWGELVYQLGVLWSVFGLYFLLRYLIRDEEDVKRAIRALGYVTMVVAGFMVYERVTGRNLFYAILGGAQAAVFSTAMARGDAYRATGCFGHPLLAGSFGGFMLPLFIGYWLKENKGRLLIIIGAVAALIIPFITGTSTAVFALLGGIAALFAWPLRRRMRIVRWTIALLLVSLHLLMRAPVWHLIARVSLSEGSSSYHRYELVNQCILHFWDWALVGTKNYASWGWMMWDLCNQYVRTADTGGLIPLIALIAILVYGFKYVGRARRYYEGDRKRERFIWAISACLFANAVAFMGVSYFDQIIVPWYAVLAMISVVTLAARKAQVAGEVAAGTDLSLDANGVMTPNFAEGRSAFAVGPASRMGREGFSSYGSNFQTEQFE
jgi:hypothetical protein